MKTRNVLIVDDDEAFLDLLEGLLRALGVERVTRATSGLEAYSLLKKPDADFNCVLSDISMVPGTGTELLKIVRSTGGPAARPDITFVLVTAMEDEDVRSTARGLGASGFLLKPVGLERLREAIHPSRFRDVFQPIRGMLEH